MSAYPWLWYRSVLTSRWRGVRPVGWCAGSHGTWSAGYWSLCMCSPGISCSQKKVFLKVTECVVYGHVYSWSFGCTVACIYWCAELEAGNQAIWYKESIWLRQCSNRGEALLLMHCLESSCSQIKEHCVEAECIHVGNLDLDNKTIIMSHIFKMWSLTRI